MKIHLPGSASLLAIIAPALMLLVSCTTPPIPQAVPTTQDWPAKPLKMVVAFPAGGSDDILGRILAPRLSALLGQPGSVENAEGAGGMTGASRVAKASPNGYEFMLGTLATHVLSQVLHKRPPYDSTRDFAPVALVAEQPFVLIGRKDLPSADLKQFIAYARASRGKLRYGSAGAGSATHLVCALFNAAAGIQAEHIPYDGGAPAMRDLLAGRIDYLCPVVTIAIAEIQNDRLKAIAIFAKNRAPILPNLASAQEQGLTGFTANTWFAIFLPRDTPAPIVGKLHDATVAGMETPALQAWLKDIGASVVTPERRTPDYLRDFLKSETEKWKAAIDAANLKID